MAAAGLRRGPLTEANGFASQADVLVNTRVAADALGATKMDRPEDFETNPVNGKVYLVCTNNTQRGPDGDETDRPTRARRTSTATSSRSPRTATTTPPPRFAWDDLHALRRPGAAARPTSRASTTALVSPFSAPDNITFDMDGNLWISTDGMPNNLPGNDGLFAVPTDGEERGYLNQFFSSVAGAEVSGPVFNPDNTALFASIQHPGEGGTFEEPISHWPDGAGPLRPSVVVIQAMTPTARSEVPRSNSGIAGGSKPPRIKAGLAAGTFTAGWHRPPTGCGSARSGRDEPAFLPGQKRVLHWRRHRR